MGTKIIIEKNIDVPMRDGCVLKADLFRPDTPEKLPVLLNRTPYDKKFPQISFNTIDAIRAAERGYNVVFVDCRGRYASPGKFTCFVDEQPRRLRHDRAPRARTVGGRQGRNVWRVVHGRDAMARGDADATESQGDGPEYHGQRLSRQLDLSGRRVFAVFQCELADEQSRAGAPDARARGERFRAKRTSRHHVDDGYDADADGFSAAQGISAVSHRRALLFRLARPSQL